MIYKDAGKKFIVQGGDKHQTTNHSFNAETNFESAINLNCTRVVSCNTTSILRVMGALKKGGILKSVKELYYAEQLTHGKVINQES